MSLFQNARYRKIILRRCSLPAVLSLQLNNFSQYTQNTFSPDYICPIIILAECTDLNKKLGNLHPNKVVKFFFLIFIGITKMKSTGSKKKSV